MNTLTEKALWVIAVTEAMTGATVLTVQEPPRRKKDKQDMGVRRN